MKYGPQHLFHLFAESTSSEYKYKWAEHFKPNYKLGKFSNQNSRITEELGATFSYSFVTETLAVYV